VADHGAVNPSRDHVHNNSHNTHYQTYHLHQDKHIIDTTTHHHLHQDKHILWTLLQTRPRIFCSSRTSSRYRPCMQLKISYWATQISKTTMVVSRNPSRCWPSEDTGHPRLHLRQHMTRVRPSRLESASQKVPPHFG